jgi:hypothetical protein
MTRKNGTRGPEPSSFPSHNLFNIPQAAAYLGRGVTERWIFRHIYEIKDINSLKLGRKRLIPRAELDRIVAEGRNV